MKDQPVASYAARVELAKTIGTVRPDKGRYMIDICVDGERYKLRHLPVAAGCPTAMSKPRPKSSR